MSADLTKQLATAAANAEVKVLLRADTLGHATSAVSAAGLGLISTLPSIHVVQAIGTPAQIRATLRDSHVQYVQTDPQIHYFGSTTDNQATREDQARTLTDAAGAGITGAGVTIAIVDTGVDGTHPYFQLPDGTSKVVVNDRSLCNSPVNVNTDPDPDTCFQAVPGNNSDAVSAGGHGTHVTGIAAGVDTDVTTTAGTTVHIHGAAPGAKVAMFSVGTSDTIGDALGAFEWIDEHHAAPCGAGVSAATCPPIRVVSNSYGPGGGAFDPSDATALEQEQLVKDGVVVVWAAGNDGGDGTANEVNPDSQDPTPGIISVAAYDDGGVGSSNNRTASFSSRGLKGSQTTYPDIAAPGVLILSSCREEFSLCAGNPSYENGDFQSISGTSMATPYVSGVVADLAQANPSATPAQIENTLEDTAHQYVDGAPYEFPDSRNPAATTGTSFDKGHGLVDVLAAAQAELGDAITPEAGAPAPVVSCGGLNLVVDSVNDAQTPLGPGDPTTLDIEDVSMSLSGSTVTTTLTINDLQPGALAPVPFPSINYFVSWYDNVKKQWFATEASLPDPTSSLGFSYGTWDPSAQDLTTINATTGTVVTGKDGTISVTYPLPAGETLPVTSASASPFSQVSAFVQTAGGAEGIDAVTFTAPGDTAPDAGIGPTWAVCPNGGDVNAAATGTGVGTDLPEAPMAALLAVVAVLAVGGVAALRRRRTS